MEQQGAYKVMKLNGQTDCSRSSSKVFVIEHIEQSFVLSNQLICLELKQDPEL